MQLGDGGEGRGEVRVPEPDRAILCVALERVQHPAPHRLCLAAILRQLQQLRAAGRGRDELLQEGHRAVGRAVIHEDQTHLPRMAEKTWLRASQGKRAAAAPHRGRLCEVRDKRSGAEPLLLVVAGHDES